MTVKALIRPTDLERIIRGARKAGVRNLVLEWPDGPRMVIPTGENEELPPLSPQSTAEPAPPKKVIVL